MHVSAVVLFSKMTERLSLVSHTLLICQTYIILRERDTQQQISIYEQRTFNEVSVLCLLKDTEADFNGMSWVSLYIPSAHLISLSYD